MASVNERSLGVARLYARAMLAVAEEEGVAESLGEELERVLEQAGRDAEFGDFLSSPILERGRRRDSIEAMMRGRASDLLVDSLQVVNKKDRLSILGQILQAYREALRDLRGQLEVRISTAVPLNDEQRAGIVDRVTVVTGKQPYLIEKVDPDLLGGVVARIGDEKVDMSVRRDLELIGTKLTQRLTNELLRDSDFGSEGDLGGDEAADSQDGRDEEE